MITLLWFLFIKFRNSDVGLYIVTKSIQQNKECNECIYLFFIASKMYYSLQLIVCIMKQFLNIGSYLKEIIRVKGDPKLS